MVIDSGEKDRAIECKKDKENFILGQQETAALLKQLW